jgi:Amt family ammonium transporter
VSAAPSLRTRLHRGWHGASALALALFALPLPALAQDAAARVDKGDVAWLLTSTLLVVLMALPGLALFYGGMVRARNVLSVLMQVLAAFCLVVVLWLLYGYSLAFTPGNAVIGGLDTLFLRGVGIDSVVDTFSAGVQLPELAFIAFQATFAGITCALIVGAIAERARFAAVLTFVALWFTFAYLPVAHMVWGSGGLLLGMGAIDFAGGTVVHINAGVAALVAAWRIGPRRDHGRQAIKPHDVVLTVVGACLLWVGWFGFNAGSNLEANAGAALAVLNTLAATAAAVLAWTALERLVKGQPSVLGAASGAVAGLVGITPACGSVGPIAALAIGALASALALWGVNGLKRVLHADDSLDVFGVHGVAGIAGALLTGVFAAPWLGGMAGADFDMPRQLAVQALSVGLTIAWSAVVALGALQVAAWLFGLRVDADAEQQGLDIASHGEAAYDR